MSVIHVELLPVGNLVSLLQLHTGDDLWFTHSQVFGTNAFLLPEGGVCVLPIFGLLFEQEI